MANTLINGTATELQDGIDYVLRGLHTNGMDSVNNGKLNIKTLAPTDLSADVQGQGNLQGKIPYILNTDINNEDFKDLSVNPALDLKTGEFNESALVGYGTRNQTIDETDFKQGIIIYDKDAIENTDNLFKSSKSCMWSAGRAVGTFKQMMYAFYEKFGAVEVFKTFDNIVFPNALTGITGDFEIITRVNSVYYRVNLLTNVREAIAGSHAIYNLPLVAAGNNAIPNIVEKDGYYYYLGVDKNSWAGNLYSNFRTGGKIVKVNKNDLTFVMSTMPSEVGLYNYYDNINIVKIGDSIYIRNNYHKDKLFELNLASITNGATATCTEKALSEILPTLPQWMLDNNSVGSYGFKLSNLGEALMIHLKIALPIYEGSSQTYDYYVNIPVSNINDIVNSINTKDVRFGNSYAYRKTSNGKVLGINVTAFSTVETYEGDFARSKGSRVQLVSGQVFSVAEWETPYENDGTVETRLKIFD